MPFINCASFPLQLYESNSLIYPSCLPLYPTSPFLFGLSAGRLRQIATLLYKLCLKLTPRWEKKDKDCSTTNRERRRLILLQWEGRVYWFMLHLRAVRAFTGTYLIWIIKTETNKPHSRLWASAKTPPDTRNLNLALWRSFILRKPLRTNPLRCRGSRTGPELCVAQTHCWLVRRKLFSFLICFVRKTSLSWESNCKAMRY